MSNGQQVLTGNRGNGINQQQQQLGGQQQNTAAANPLAQLASFSARVAGAANNPSSGTSLYTTTSSRNNYAHLLCLEDNEASEQMKAQALVDAGNFATQIFNICARRIAQNPFYRVFTAAQLRFKTPQKNGPADPQLEAFICEIDSNVTLYQFILVNASIMFSSDFANCIMRGDERIRTDRALVDDMYYRCAIDTIYMQYYDFLANHPDGSQIYYRLNPQVKTNLAELEDKLYDLVLGKFTFANVQCPWRKGRLSELTQRATQPNPLFDDYAATDMGFVGTYYDPNASLGMTPQNTTAAEREMHEFVLEQVRKNNQQNAGNPQPIQPEQNQILQTTYNDFDRDPLRLADMTRDNMHNYNISNWGSQVPGTEWWVIREEDVLYFTNIMTMDDGIPFRARDTRVLGHTPVYRFNWQAGTFNFRLVKNNIQAFNLMSTLISNPEKLLPFMYEEDGLQKTTFEPIVMETNQFANDGKFIPVGEMKVLEKEPNILVGNKPMLANEGNDKLVSRLNIYTKTFDTKGKLDAFVLPTIITREWKMEPHVNMARFYSQFKVMVQGNDSGVDDTIQAIRHIRGAWMECDSEQFREFVKPYITNLVNRWLIECRGYNETKNEGEGAYLKSSDIFEDLDDWVEWLKERDLPTLRAFTDYRFNTFMRTGIEALVSQEEVQKEYALKYSKEEDEIIVNAMMEESKTAVIIRRNTIFINLTKQVAPPNVEAVVIKDSVNPEIFAIIREAIKITNKHFENKPQILLKFNTDSGNKVYTVTPSDIDPDSVLTIRTISEGQAYCCPYPVMD